MRRSTIQYTKAVVFIVSGLITTLLGAYAGILNSSDPLRWVPLVLLVCGGLYIWNASYYAAQERDDHREEE